MFVLYYSHNRPVTVFLFQILFSSSKYRYRKQYNVNFVPEKKAFPNKT